MIELDTRFNRFIKKHDRWGSIPYAVIVIAFLVLMSDAQDRSDRVSPETVQQDYIDSFNSGSAMFQFNVNDVLDDICPGTFSVFINALWILFGCMVAVDMLDYLKSFIWNRTTMFLCYTSRLILFMMVRILVPVLLYIAVVSQ